MTRYCKDMCIVCFAPKRYDSQWLYAPVSENSHETCVSEVGLLYQDLIQVSLTCKESGPQYVCNYCKTQLSLFNKFKLKALDAYKKVSDEAEEQESGTDNLVKVEEITVFDVSTKQTEKFEIQYLDDHEEEAADIIEIEDSKTFLDEVPGASANGLNTHQNSISVNSSSSNSTSSLYHIKCQLCSKFFDSNESFNVHWKEHEELPQYSFGTISQFDSGESDLEIIDFDGRINDQLRHPFRNGLQLPGCSPRSLFNSADPEELSYISNMTTSKQNRKCYMTENSPNIGKAGNFRSEDLVKKKREKMEELLNHHGNLRYGRRVRKGCGQSCPLACITKITEKQRTIIFDDFWKLNDSEKKQFYIENVEKIPVLKKRYPSDLPSRKNFTFKYSFTVNGEKHLVCKTFFLATICVSARRIYYSFKEEHRHFQDE